MNEFAAFLRSLGLHPGYVSDDGKWRRCSTDEHPRKKNGAYKLLPGGRIGFAQDWASMSEPAVWRAEREADLPVLDLDAMRRAQEAAQRDRREAIGEARAYYESCRPLRYYHPYLRDHGLDMTGCYGLRVDKDEWLVVPAWKGSQIQSVQRISPDGDKRFWPGAPIAGTQYVIRRHDEAEITVLCEGLATGLACIAALMNDRKRARGIVLWNAGNLAKTEYRTRGWVIVAADNDHETAERTGRNPGVDAAIQAATRIGAGVAYPTGIRGTDWADYRRERREERLEKILPHQTRWRIERSLDGEISAQLMKAAKYVAERGAV